jgi:hypothetical protein
MRCAYVMIPVVGMLLVLFGCSVNHITRNEMLVEADYRSLRLKDHVSVDSSGFDDKNATFAIQSAIDSGASTIIVPFVGKPYYVDPIVLTGNMTLILEEGVVIAAKDGSFRGGGKPERDHHNWLRRGY